MARHTGLFLIELEFDIVSIGIESPPVDELEKSS